MEEELEQAREAVNILSEKLEEAYKELDEIKKNIKLLFCAAYLVISIFLVGLIVSFVSKKKNIFCESFF